MKGLFTEENPQQAVKYLRERIHFIGFIHEQDYMESEIAARTAPRYNPHLFASPDAAQNAWNTYPLASPE